MKAELLPDKLTVWTMREALDALADAYERLNGRRPTAECLAVHGAQLALESGRFRYCHWNNPGNVKAGPNYEGFYCQYRCNEVIKGKIEWFDPPHPQCNFRAHQDRAEGVFAHLKFVRDRYPAAWLSAEHGAPLDAVNKFHAAGYFTADPGPYARSVGLLWRELLLLTQDATRDTIAPPDPAEEALHEEARALIAPSDHRWVQVAAYQALELSDPLAGSLDERRKAMLEE